MLKNVPKILSPELLKALCEMGHGDEITIGDANFPAYQYHDKVIRADGLKGTDLLDAILKMIPLDTYSDYNIILMNTINGDPTPDIWEEYEKIALENDKNAKIIHLDRYDFYDRVKKSFCVVESGEERIYANIIIRKNVIK